MNFPGESDFIDIHNHGAIPRPGCFSVENLMANEERLPDSTPGLSYSYGIHPWHLEAGSFEKQINCVRQNSFHENVIAIGEAGFDRIKGPDRAFQERAFTEQVIISGQSGKPLFIHCVRAWEELLGVHAKTRPLMPWIIHGFRGKPELAKQLISRGMYISFWFDYILRPESALLVRSIPSGRIFLETDGSGIDIIEIYRKVSSYLNIDIEMLKKQIYNNFITLFG